MNVNERTRPGTRLVTPVAEPSRAEQQGKLATAAYIATKLAIARWQIGSRNTSTGPNEFHQSSARVRWYARAEEDLQEWIARGGFAQEDGPAVSGASRRTGHAREDSAAE